MIPVGRVRLALWAALLAACVAVIARTQISTDMSAFLPRSPSPAQQVLVDQVREGVVSRLILLGLEGAPPAALAKLSRELARRLRGVDAFASVSNGDDSALAAERDFLWRNRFVLSPSVAPARFTSAGLHDALQRDVELLSSGLAVLVKQTLASDPTGEMLTVIDEFLGEHGPHKADGVWFSPDETRALVVVQTRAGGLDTDAQQQALRAIDDAFRAARQVVPEAAAAHLLETGPGVFAVHTRATMEEDVSRFSTLATVLIAGLLLFAYRSLRVLLLGLLPVLCGALAGFAAVSLGFGFVHGITLGFGVTLMGESVDYPIYLFTQTSPESRASETLTRIWPTLRLGVLTSIAGFSAMLFSSFTGFAQLGLFSITGLVVAVAVTRWILPTFLPRDFAAAGSSVLAPAVIGAMRRARRLRVPALALVLAAAALLAFHRDGFWQEELASLSPISPADQELDRQLRRDVGAPDVRYLAVVTAAGEQEALAASERLSGALSDLIAAKQLTGFDAPDRYLPSARTQLARKAALPDEETLRTRLHEALAGFDFRPDFFAPFLADVAAAKRAPPIAGDSLPPQLSLKLGSLLFARRGGWVAMLPLRGVEDPPLVAARIGALNEPGAAFIDLKGESDHLLQTYQRQAVLLALIGSLIILALLSVSLRSPARLFVVVAPMAASVIVTTALLTLGDRRLSIFNLVGLLLIVAVGSNYCLFFERQHGDPGNSERTAVSLVLANSCTVIGFGVLALSRIPVLHDMGLTVAPGALLTLLFGAMLSAAAAAPRRPEPERTREGR